MIKIIFVLFLFGVGCSPLRNPYYRTKLVGPPYMELYVVNNERENNILVNGKIPKSDTFDIFLPDTIKGGYDVGRAVSEITLDKKYQISRINIVGMTLYDMDSKKRTVYDKFCFECKKINLSIPPDLSEYASFIKESIKSYSFERKADAATNSRKVYIFLKLYKTGYENIYIN